MSKQQPMFTAVQRIDGGKRKETKPERWSERVSVMKRRARNKNDGDGGGNIWRGREQQRQHIGIIGKDRKKTRYRCLLVI